MDGAPAVPNGLDRRAAMTDGEYAAEGWLYKLSSSHMGKDKFQKRWFMIAHTPNGGSLSYCPSPEDRTITKEPLVRPPVLAFPNMACIAPNANKQIHVVHPEVCY